MSDPTIADLVRAQADPHQAAIAKFTNRFKEDHQVTFSFNDGSKVVFKIKYELVQPR